jgi:hypothetical protein
MPIIIQSKLTSKINVFNKDCFTIFWKQNREDKQEDLISSFTTYYIHDKITAIWLVKRSAIISLIALSRSAINDFRDGWGEREIKTTKPLWRRNLDKYF